MTKVINQMFQRRQQLNVKKTFDRLAFLNSAVHRACSHDAPKNFVLPLLEHHRLVGSCLVITRRRTGTTAILVVSERGVGARLGNIRSRKNTKCFADYSRAASTTQLRHGIFKHDRNAKMTSIESRERSPVYVEAALYCVKIDFINDYVYGIFNSWLRYSSRVIEVTLEHHNISLSS